MPGLLSDRLLTSTETRFETDWQRQRRTAADILARLRSQEGVILADQVGMGKTYVALAVAVSQILSTDDAEQVVIFVPAAVADKWIREWRKFSETLLEPGTGIRCVPAAIRSGEDFLKALDDPPERRNHLIVVTHTALTATLKDSFVKLALVHYITRRARGGGELRQRFAKWSAGRSGIIPDGRFTPQRVAKLLDTPPGKWRETWRRVTGEWLSDDPVPAALEVAAGNLDTSAARAVLANLPVRRSADITGRLKRAREELSTITQGVWKWMLASIQLDLPLLIVDEAHRLKNNSTQISRLFAERSGAPNEGVLDNVFRRMLFLTATPFELGHYELTAVLSRMGAVRELRPSPALPLAQRLDELERVLVAAQTNAITFDAAWGRLAADDLAIFDDWCADRPAPQGLSAAAHEAWEHARLAVQARHQMHTALRPWVIRHVRDRRRDYHPGRAIASADGAAGGLEIPEEAALPFLLAARAQSVALDEAGPARPLFAYGIASSYEAFRRLGSGTTEDVDSDRSEDERTEDDPSRRVHATGAAAVAWYREEVDRALQHEKIRDAHPKVRASVEKAAQLWLAGDKCLIFCWFIRTGIAVERALGTRIEELTMQRAAAPLRTVDADSTREALDRFSDRLFRSDSSSYERTKSRLTKALTEAAHGYDDVLDLVVDAAIRHMRTRGYLVRYTPLNRNLTDDDIWAGIQGDNPASLVLIDRWQRFAERLAMARDQIHAIDPAEEHDSEFSRVSTALLGARSEDDAAVRRGASLRPVRRASGQTERRDRERLIALFNTPFAPDLLVASSVMGEGIDLHQECRHVIHHDLDWNPSVLEQRTGRLDRIGALAEREAKNIEIYEPYLAGTHDEKMFRVVKDRAGWFDIVMGRASSSDEHATDTEEHRVPLHPKIKAALTMDLRSPRETAE